MTVLSNFLYLSGEVETLEKRVGQAVIPSNFKSRYKRSPYDSGVFFY